MKTINIEINDKEYKVLVAQTEEEKERGLMDVEEMNSGEGMLFWYDAPQEVSFWMHDTSIPLLIVFIDKDWEVIKTVKGEPFDETPITCDNVQYVLEVNQDENIKPGDEVEIDDEEFDPWKELEPNKMYIFGSDGEVQAEIVGGERIMSIKNTKTLIRMAKRAYSTKKESDYKRLGRKIFEYLNTQDNNEPEYVTQTENKKGEY